MSFEFIPEEIEEIDKLPRNEAIFFEYIFVPYVTLHDLAKKHGVQNERIRQIICKQRRKLRSKIIGMGERIDFLHAEVEAKDKIIESLQKGEAVNNIEKQSKIHIDNLEISVRLRNCLANDECWYVDDIYSRYTEVDLLRIPNFGRTSLRELNEVLENLFGKTIGQYQKEKALRYGQ